jgi:hypothetical protein
VTNTQPKGNSAEHLWSRGPANVYCFWRAG